MNDDSNMGLGSSNGGGGQLQQYRNNSQQYRKKVLIQKKIGLFNGVDMSDAKELLAVEKKSTDRLHRSIDGAEPLKGKKNS